MQKYLEIYPEGTTSESWEFWEIDLPENANSFTLRFGKIDTEGQSETLSFESYQQAFQEAEKLIQEKLQQGYIDPEAEEEDLPSKYDLDEQEGKVAIWANVWFEENNEFIGWYDHDYVETFTVHFEEQQSEFPYSSFIPSLTKVVNKYPELDKKYLKVFLLFDHISTCPVGFLTEEEKQLKGVEADSEAIFLGNFDFRWE